MSTSNLDRRESRTKSEHSRSSFNCLARNRDRHPSRSWELHEWFTWETFKFGLPRYHSGALDDQLPRDSNASGAGWKPVTLRTPILGGFVLVSTSIVVILEVLSHISLREGNNGGLVFSKDVDTLPTIAVFGYLYFPTVFAVCYSIIWSWIDLDVKRLEPWFQLSKEGGARASDSLLLQYPFDFLPFIPVTAARRKHWGVFFAGTVLLLIFWIIVPLQSAIFNAGTTMRSIPINFVTTHAITPTTSQQDVLSSNFLNTAYGVAWLGQKLPPFTTGDFAVLPFGPASTPEISSDTLTMSTTSQIYSTTLDCEAAKTKDAGGDPHTDWALANPNCTKEHSSNFLALWTSEDYRIGEYNKYSNITALFCRTRYHVQEVIVTANVSDGAIVSSDFARGNTDDISTMSTDILNITHFEFISGVGNRPNKLSERGDYPDTSILEQFSTVQDLNVSWPIPNMVGFALGLNKLPIEALSDPRNLHHIFEKAHQLLFSTAFSILAQPLNQNIPADLRTGIIQGILGAILMSRTLSVIVEVTVGLVVLMTAALWYISRTRHSKLRTDPATMADIMSYIHTKGDVSKGDCMSTADTPNLRAAESPATLFWLSGNKHHGVVKLFPNVLQGHEDAELCLSGASLESYTDECLPVLRPLELRLSLGFFFSGTILLALIGVVLVELWTTRNNGLRLPSSNATVLSIIENYIPTAFATLIEPAWVLLNRMLCLLKPYDELRRGNAKVARSVRARYTSLPPQLVVWRALRSGHFLLALICTTAMSTNLLAVALSGLVIEKSTTVKFEMLSNQQTLPRFKGEEAYGRSKVVDLDHHYALMSNLTAGTALPPWVDKEFYYIPFETGSPRTSTDSGTPLGLQSIRGSTTGFGFNVFCFEMSKSQDAETSVSLQPSIEDVGGRVPENGILINTTHIMPDGARISCTPYRINPGNSSSSSSAFEFLRTGPIESVDDTALSWCETLITAGWFRAEKVPSSSHAGLKLLNPSRKTSQTIIGCQPQLHTAIFDVYVDTTGRLLKSVRTTELATDLSHLFPNASSVLTTAVNQIIDSSFSITGGDWHNDTMTSDWINSLFGYTIHSNRYVNPDFPAPDTTEAIELMQQTLTQLAALFLNFKSYMFVTSPTPVEKTLTVFVTEPRIFLDPLMFKVTIALLSLQLTVAILYYSNRPKRFLTRLPTSIAAIISFVYASRALEDFSQDKGKEKDDKGEEEQRYAYGRFVGTDGKTHVGIERQRFVVPLESRNPGVRRRRRWMFWNGGRGNNDEGEVKCWI